MGKLSRLLVDSSRAHNFHIFLDDYEKNHLIFEGTTYNELDFRTFA